MANVSLSGQLIYVARAVVLSYVGAALDFYNDVFVKMLGGFFAFLASPSKWAVKTRSLLAGLFPLLEKAFFEVRQLF